MMLRFRQSILLDLPVFISPVNKAVFIFLLLYSISILDINAKEKNSTNLSETKFGETLLCQAKTGNTAIGGDGVKNKSDSTNDKTVSDAPKRFGSHMEPIFSTVGASEEQRREIISILEECRPRIEPLRAELELMRAKFRSEMSSTEGKQTIMHTQMELGQLESSLRSEYLIMRLKIRKTLTPEQVKKYEEYCSQQGWTAK